MKSLRWLMVIAAAALLLTLGSFTLAADQGKDAKTITGSPSCGGCAGAVKGCCVMLTDKDGVRWVLRGDSDALKAAFKKRHGSQSMTATLSGEPATKKGKDGKEYREVQVSDVKIQS